MKSAKRGRFLIRAVTLAFILVVLVFLSQEANVFMRTELLQVDDFVEYWAAGRLNIGQGNPYDPNQLLPLQLGVGRFEGVPVMMWNPPYVLPIAMPLALLDYPDSRFVWFLTNVVLIAIGATWLWRVYQGPERRLWLAWIIAFSFYPTFALLQTGQIGGLLFLGVAGFLYFQGRRDWLAGVLAALTAIKPHLLYLFWVVLFVWSVTERRWRVLLGAAGALLGGVAMAFALNPLVVQQYVHATTTFPPLDWATPTLGGFMRLLLGQERSLLQFLPALLGLSWLAYHWWRYRSDWRWPEQMPMVVLVSVLTAVYGWSSDKVVLILVPISVAAWLASERVPRVVLVSIWTSYVLINLLAYVRHGGRNDFEYIWLGPALLLWFLGISWYRASLGARESQALSHAQTSSQAPQE